VPPVAEPIRPPMQGAVRTYRPPSEVQRSTSRFQLPPKWR